MNQQHSYKISVSCCDLMYSSWYKYMRLYYSKIWIMLLPQLISLIKSQASHN